MIDLSGIEKARLELQEAHDRYLEGKISDKEYKRILKEADKKSSQFEKALQKLGF